MNIINTEIQRYCDEHSCKPSQLLLDLEEDTVKTQETPQMLSGHLEGTFLKMLVKISGAKNILELGLFTGYSALSMAESLPDDGKLISCEINHDAIEFAKKYIDSSPHGHKIEVKVGSALDLLPKMQQTFDLAFIDADKLNYQQYYELVLTKLKVGGLIIIDNTLWSGRVINPDDASSVAIAKLNDHINTDDRVENVLLPVRDGITLIVKK